MIAVRDEDAFASARRLAREDVLAGVSSVLLRAQRTKNATLQYWHATAAITSAWKSSW
jgi:cysteine synthase